MPRHFRSSPSQGICGECQVPGDKSISHRALIFAAIAEGTSDIEGFLEGEDCMATLKAFQAMGVNVKRLAPSKLQIKGVGKYGLQKPANIIDCGNSGTSMRLLAGLLVGQRFDSQLNGDESLQKRPMERIRQPLSLMGAHLHTTQGHPPLFIQGGQPLKGLHYTLPVASAQVKSAILLAGMYAQGETVLTEPQITRDHTEKMLRTFSYPLKQTGKQLMIDSTAKCLATSIKIPGDLSSAAFFIVAATITPGSELIIKNVGINATRTGVLQILQAMGANIQLLNQQLYGEEKVADLWVKYSPLQGINIPASLVSLAIDEFPVIFIAAAAARGKTSLRGAKELRMKESDRILAMVEGLRQLGIQCKDQEDGADIIGGELQGGNVDSFNDHRIAMAFAMAGAIARDPVTIKNCDNVATSFPNFIEIAQQINLDIVETKQ